MSSVALFLELSYLSNDAAKERHAADIAEEDARRLDMLVQFADAKLIVTALRALEEASAGRLGAAFETHQFMSDNPVITIKIRDTKVADRALSMSPTTRDDSHGFRLIIDQNGAVLKRQNDSDYFFRPAATEEEKMLFAEDSGLVRMNEINGAVPALEHVFDWAGKTKDEDGKWYIERPRVYLASFNRDKPAPAQ